jgi:hypothetical protein
MLNREQFYDQVKNDTKNAIFEKQMALAVQERLKQVQEDRAKTYSERVNRRDYTNTTVTDNKVTRFTIADDEPTLQPKMWQSALTDAAFYFDHPTVQ